MNIFGTFLILSTMSNLSSLKDKYLKDDLDIVSGMYKKDLKGEGYGDLTEHYQNIFNEIMTKNDEFFILYDFESYREAQLKIQEMPTVFF